MPFGLQLTVTNTITPTTRAVARGIQPDRLNPVIGRAGVNVVRRHLLEKNRSSPNQMRGPRTNFYANAGRSAHFDLVGDNGVIVSVNSIGIAQRFYGGTIKPRPGKKFLAIPAVPESYGKTPREFGQLVLVFGHGGQPIALATPVSNAPRRLDKDGRAIGKPVLRAGVILFRLLRSVTQQPDPTVLPTTLDLYAGIISAANAYTDRLIERAGQPGGAQP